MSLFVMGCGRMGLYAPTEVTPPATGPNDARDFVPDVFVPIDGYFMSLTVSAEDVTADLDEFPLVVWIVDDALRTVGNGGFVLDRFGADFLILDDQSEPVPFETVEYNEVTGELLLWVRADLSSSTGAELTLFYGSEDYMNVKPSSDDTWSSDYVASWHFEEVSGPRGDSTSNGIMADDLTAEPGSDGLLGRAAWFASDADSLQVGLIDETFENGGLQADTSDFTISGWIYLVEHTGDWDTIFEKGIFTTNNGYGLYVDRTAQGGQGAQTLGLYMEDNQNLDRMRAPSAPINLDTWHHVAAVVDRDAQVVDFYLDGIYRGFDTTSLQSDDNIGTMSDSTIGQHTGLDNCCALRGGIDELRISKATRSAAWISAEYRSQHNPDFVQVGPHTAFP